MATTTRNSVSPQGGEEGTSDLCGFLGFMVGVISMFLVVGAIATLAVLGVDHREEITSLSSTHPVKALSYGVKELVQDYSSMKTRVIDDTQIPSKELDLLILVRSMTENSSSRDQVRETWKKNRPPGVEVVFVVPAVVITSSKLEAIKQESKTNRDMVVFLDGPVVPESEGLLMGMAWATHSRKFLYLMSTRDSMYIRLDVLKKSIIDQLIANHANVYFGYFEGKQSPVDAQSTKLPEPDWFLCDTYIRFAHSGGYILSSKLVHRLHSQSSVLFPYNNEDVAVGAWLSPYDDIDWMHNTTFDTEIGLSRGCRNNWVVVPALDMASMHARVSSGGTLCLMEHEAIPTYTYNFYTSPSQCCSDVVNFGHSN